MSKGKEKNGDDMAAVMERIITVERSESDAFIKLQMKRISQLQEIEARRNQGKRIQQGRIVIKLQGAGILDAHGNLSSRYSEED